ncbi:MAG: hypothetical protein K0B07_00460 [DPANN group archaeon]|nr:hypothetical protein [DPANN group archaeon]
MQNSVIEYIKKGLIGRDFELIQFERYCFDIAAKKKDAFILIKILSNVDSFSSAQADDLKNMGSAIGASPVICGIRGRNFKISENYVYERFGIYVVHPETFLNSLDLVLPFILSRKGKNTVSIDTERLHDIRIHLDLSFQKMSGTIGVSKKTLYLAEKTGRTSDYVVEAIEELINEVIRRPVDIFSSEMHFRQREKTMLEKKLTQMTSKFGYSDFVFHTAPVKIVLKADDDSCMCDAESKFINEQKMSDLKKLSEFCDFLPVVIVENTSSESSCGIAFVDIKEIRKIHSKKELIELIYGRI